MNHTRKPVRREPVGATPACSKWPLCRWVSFACLQDDGGEEGAAGGRQRPAGLHPPDLVAYMAQLAGRPGKFDPNKAKALGIRPGKVGGKGYRAMGRR